MSRAETSETAGDPAGARAALVGVSVINYRTGPMTIACVRSVLETAQDLDVSVSVVDNRSGDGSAEQIGRWIASLPEPERARVTLLRSASNSGFAGGHNQGVAAVDARLQATLMNGPAKRSWETGPRDRESATRHHDMECRSARRARTGYFGTA